MVSASTSVIGGLRRLVGALGVLGCLVATGGGTAGPSGRAGPAVVVSTSCPGGWSSEKVRTCGCIASFGIMPRISTVTRRDFGGTMLNTCPRVMPRVCPTVAESCSEIA